MAITVVQSIAHAGNPPATFGANITAGNTVFLITAGYTTTSGNPSTGTVKLGGGTVTGTVAFFNSGTTYGILSPLSGSNGAYISIWMLPNVQLASQTAVDVTFTGASGVIGQIIYEVAGLGTNPTLDVSNSGGAASGTAASSGASGAIASATEIVFGGTMAFSGTPSTNSGWTCLQPGGGTDLTAGYQIPVSSGGSYTWSQTSSGSPWAAFVVAVKPSPVPAPFYPVTWIRARTPLPPPRGVYMGTGPGDTSYGTGRIQWNSGAPVSNPGVVPVYGGIPGAIRASLPVNLRGRVRSGPGTPPNNPSAGPVFRQANQALRARTPLPLSRGVYMGLGAKDTSSGTGRIQWNAGAPVQNPTAGPVFNQKTYPFQATDPLPRRGRVYGISAGGPVQNPPSSGPVFSQSPAPARIRPSLPPRGRITACPGTPVRNPSAGPPFPAAHGPVQARTPLPPRGRCAGNQGVPPPPPTKPAPVYPWHGPVQARRPLPPSGRCITGNPGAPVRNPHAGPPVYPPHGPVGLANRAPGPYRKGRVTSNPGGPVDNIIFRAVTFTYGDPFFEWAYGTPYFG